MSQVSYGTITITDTTDLTTYIRYAKKSPLTEVADFQETPTTDTHFIAVLSIPSSNTIPAWNSTDWKWSEFIGTDGLSVKSTRILYYLKTNSTNVPQVNKNTSIVSTDIQNAWTSKNPTYVANGTYWTCLEVTLSDDITKSWSAPAEDLGLTQAAKDAQGAMSQSSAALQRVQAKYGTSDTGATAPAKVASCEGFQLFNGAEVFIKFTNKNDVANPTLNVNSTGAKSIRDSDGNALDSKFYWKDGSLVHFVYDGTYWRILDIVTTEKYNNLVSDINGISQTVGTKASQIDLTNLTTRVSTNETNISQTATSITSLVSNQDTYTAPDGTTKTNTIKSAIKQNADNISLRVEKNGVIAAINASTESSGGSAVKISADKVNIEGAAIFTSGRLSTANLNDTIDGRIPEIPDDISDLTDTTGKIPTKVSDLSDSSSYAKTTDIPDVSGFAVKTDAVYRTQRIYRRYTSAQSNLSGPTTWVTANTNIYNNWTTKIPPLTNGNTIYAYLYTCVQKQTITQYNGGTGTTCTCTPVLLDDTTTVINGGSIIAGSVTANEITGNTLSAIYADMGTLTAGKIEKGYNSINFNNTPATLEFKNQSTWDASTQGIKYSSNGLDIKGAITATSLTIGNGATVSGLSTSNINGMSDYALQSSLDTEVAQRKAVYAVSTTGATTTAKTTESGTPSGFVLYNGATVTIKFNSANSTTTPTLNVNGTGAKTIKSYTGTALTAAEYTWPAGAAITFTYDGSYWRMQDSGALQAKADAAASASEASSQASAASSSATAANSAKTAAESAKSAAQSAQTASESAKTAAQSAQSAAETASGQATTAKNDAVSAKTAAQAAQTAAETAKGQAQTAASNASQSETNAAASATAAAEVMGGFTILWNYSAFGTATTGDAFICGFDSATGTKSDGNGWVKWNNTKRTITKQQVNPGTIVPYNIPIYIVCRLSSATATTGTNYMVWYNAGWKYAACPSPTAVGGSWTWTDNRDIILGSFVETGANEALTECELFNPPWTSKQITTNTTTPTSYIMDVDSNRGIAVKPKDSSGNDFLQMNSTAIEFFRNSTTASVMRLTDNSFRLGLEASNHTTIDTNGLHIWAGAESTATNELALFGASGAQIGSDDLMHVSIDADSFTMTDTNDAEIAHIGSPSSSTVTDTFYCTTDNGRRRFYLAQSPNDTPIVKVNGTATTDFSLNDNEIFIHFLLSKGDIITATYETISAVPFYTFGTRINDAGAYSLAEGQNSTASGYCSHAEGHSAQALGVNSHAEGFSSEANGNSSHVEGSYCAANNSSAHAEGNSTKADGLASHAEGHYAKAIGDYSHAQNRYTTANYEAQTAIGKYNDNQSDTALEIGNGSNDLNRSNCFTVDWNGGVQLYLDVDSSASSSTDATSGTDKDLFNVIRAMGWYSDVIS